MLFRTTAFCFAILLLVPACGTGGSGTQRVEVDSVYAVELPGWLESHNELHDFAGLQYGSEAEGVFVLGICEEKADLKQINLHYTLRDYEWFVRQNMKRKLDTLRPLRSDTLPVGGVPAICSSFIGLQKGDSTQLEVYYELGVYETEHHFCQLVAWTRETERAELEPELRSIITSFHPLPRDSASAP